MPDEPTIWASIGMKINIGNFENQDINFGYSGIPYNASPEYLETVMSSGKERIHAVIESMAEELAKTLRENYGR